MAGNVRRLLTFCAFTGALAGIAYTTAAIVQVRRFRKRRTNRLADGALPSLTVLKPLCGMETALEENLRSFCRQRYPRFQLIFGAADPNDPALAVARGIASEFEGCDIRVVQTISRTARNPKVANLLGMIPYATNEVLVIADSDIRVSPTYLQAVASSVAREGVGAVTCVYGGMPSGARAARLAAMFVNDQFAPSVLVAALIEPLTYCFGATMAVRRNVLEDIGGLAMLGDRIDDDYALGNLVVKAGYRVALCPYVVRTICSERDMRSLVRHELRWARTIRSARPAGFAGSIFTFPLPFAAALALLCPSALATATLALTCVLRCLLHEESRKTFAPSTRATPWLIPVRDFLSLGVWCSAFTGRRVAWRGRRYRISGNGRMLARPTQCNDSV